MGKVLAVFLSQSCSEVPTTNGRGSALSICTERWSPDRETWMCHDFSHHRPYARAPLPLSLLVNSFPQASAQVSGLDFILTMEGLKQGVAHETYILK